MYRPGENIYDGIPWLAAAIVIVILSLLGCLLIVLFDSRFNTSSQKVVTTSESFAASKEDDLVSSTTSLPPTSFSIPTTEPIITTFSTPAADDTSVSKKPAEKPIHSLRMFKKALVSSSSDLCSEIGRNVFLKGGNVIDALIATEVCVGGLEPHSSGLGGGNIILFHNGNSTIIINGQSRAPRSVTEDTFSMKPELSREGYASIAVPGELHSLWTAYKKFGSGRVSWQSLLWPTTELLEKGYPMSSRTEQALQTVSKSFWTARREKLSRNEGEGDLLQNEELKETIRRLALSRDPVHLFYKGEIANQIVNEMKTKGGLVTKLDLVSYESSVEEPLVAKMTDHFQLLGAAPPSVFAAAQIAVKLALNITPDVFNSVEMVSDIIQQARVAIEKIGDPQFYPEAKADAINMTLEDQELEQNGNISDSDGEQIPSKISTVIAADASGSVAVLTSTLFANFGSQRFSDKLGFVWNNEMGAFNLKETKEDDVDDDVNGVQGSKRPRTSLAPLILLEDGKWKSATSLPGDLQKLGPLMKHLVQLINPDTQEENSWTAVKNSDEGLSASCESHQHSLCAGIRGY